MAFGSFEMEERAPRPKKERVERTKKEHVRPVPPPREEPDPPPAGARTRVRVLLFGRNLPLMQEFLCSMNQNMGEALSTQGLAFYTREGETLSDIVGKKKQLEQYCWTFSDRDWTYPADEGADRTYTFSISPAGDQSRAVDLSVRCVTPGTDIGWEETRADALWLLCDGGLFFREGDRYLEELQQVLATLPDRENTGCPPVCLILSQLEHLDHFRGNGARSALPEETAGRLTALCREAFDSSAAVALIPVQVYGGMECVGLDEKGDPKLRIGQSSFYQSYLPDNCQIPGLYTLETLCTGERGDPFSDAPGGSLLRRIYSHYGAKFGNIQWKPDFLTEKGDV